MKTIILATLLILTLSARASFQGKQHDDSSPISFHHILDIIKQGLGQLTLENAMRSAEQLWRYAQGSILHPRDKIIVYLTEALPKDAGSVGIVDYNQSDLTSLARHSEFVNDTKQMTVEAPLTIVNLVGKSEEEIQQVMTHSDEKMQGKKISKIMLEATPQEHAILLNSIKSPRRNLQQTQDTSYLIKFSFAIVFMIVSAYVLIAIADMQNQRDTLLYAKFVADVNN